MKDSSSKGCVGSLFKGSLLFAAIAVLCAIFAWFWFTRSITPIELAPNEIAVVEQKLTPVFDDLKQGYSPSSKSIIITEREINGYLHYKSNFGEQIQFDLKENFIIAHINTKIPDLSPVFAGKNLRARLEVLVDSINGTPTIEIVSAKAFGTSYPEKYIQEYMHTNLYDTFKEAIELDFDITSLGTVKVTEGSIKITFLD